MPNFLSKLPRISYILKGKYKKIIVSLIFILLISSLGIFILEIKPAQALIDVWGVGKVVDFAVEKVVAALLIGLGYVLLGILMVAGEILNLVAGLISGLLAYPPQGFTNTEIVMIGWAIVRDLANMFFVLILLVIAFATILRIETYGMKSLLPKLVIAALLINFSLVLAAPILDFTQLLSQFFIEQSEVEEDLATQVATALGLSKISPYKEGGEADYDWGGGAMDTVTILMGLAMAIVFSVVAIFAFLAMIVFLIIRVMILWFLLILAPAAWLLWILPATRGHFTRWWSTFLKWAFFAPAYLFFLFLAIKAFPTFLSEGVADSLGTGAEPNNLLPKLFRPDFFLQFILVLGILLGGLIMAQQMGIYGARGIMSLTKRAGRRVSGVAATQRWWKARVAAREEEAKERRKVTMRMREVSGLRQWTRERLRLTAKGRAEARARKNRVVTEEATRMGNTMDWRSVQRIAGKRAPLTKTSRLQRLAAQALLANPGTKPYNRMMMKSVTPPFGTRRYNQLRALTDRVNQTLAKKGAKGKYARYHMP